MIRVDSRRATLAGLREYRARCTDCGWQGRWVSAPRTATFYGDEHECQETT